jgi:lipoate-protein ligase A
VTGPDPAIRSDGGDWELVGSRRVGEWHLEHRRGRAGALHHAAVDLGRPTLVVNEVLADAVVLGSSQSDDLLDPAAVERAEAEVVRRRSGGGLVLLRRGEHLWIDLGLPADDRRWDDDVDRAAWRVGEAWAEVLASGVGREALIAVHRHGLEDRDAGRLVCFAALGPGEVSSRGRKVLGISQRRTRAGARVQCVVHLDWDAGATLALLRPDAASVVRPALEGRVMPAAWLDGRPGLHDGSVAVALATTLG